MEQFFQDNRTYVGRAGCPRRQAIPTFHLPSSLRNLTPTTYTLAAVGKAGMLGFDYTIDQTNVKGTTAVPAGWTPAATMPASCWIIKKSGVC